MKSKYCHIQKVGNNWRVYFRPRYMLNSSTYYLKKGYDYCSYSTYQAARKDLMHHQRMYDSYEIHGMLKECP